MTKLSKLLKQSYYHNTMEKPTGKTLDSIKRQYSGKNYTREDKIRVIKWYNRPQAKKKKLDKSFKEGYG